MNFEGKNSFMWFGQEPWVVITNPEFIKEVTNNNNQGFSKPSSAEFFKWIAQGIASENGDVYNQHKKIINPAFHQEKLKVCSSTPPYLLFYYFHLFLNCIVNAT